MAVTCGGIKRLSKNDPFHSHTAISQPLFTPLCNSLLCKQLTHLPPHRHLYRHFLALTATKPPVLVRGGYGGAVAVMAVKDGCIRMERSRIA